jgi:hypothetical protein
MTYSISHQSKREQYEAAIAAGELHKPRIDAANVDGSLASLTPQEWDVIRSTGFYELLNSHALQELSQRELGKIAFIRG